MYLQSIPDCILETTFALEVLTRLLAPLVGGKSGLIVISLGYVSFLDKMFIISLDLLSLAMQDESWSGVILFIFS